MIKSGKAQHWNIPQLPSLSRQPRVEDYGLRKFLFWDPENQLKVEIAGRQCRCGGHIKRKEITYRSLEDVEENCFIASVVYHCPRCRQTISAIDEEKMTRAGLLESEAFFALPVVLFPKSCWTVSLVTLLSDCITTRCSMRGFIGMIARNRTSKFIRMMSLYHYHVEQFQKTRATFSMPFTVEDFGDFFAHCTGYNGTLFVSEKQGYDVLHLVVKQQERFMLRFLGG